MNKKPRVPQTDRVPTAEHCGASSLLSQFDIYGPKRRQGRGLRQVLFLAHAALGTEVGVPATGESSYF